MVTHLHDFVAVCAQSCNHIRKICSGVISHHAVNPSVHPFIDVVTWAIRMQVRCVIVLLVVAYKIPNLSRFSFGNVPAVKNPKVERVLERAWWCYCRSWLWEELLAGINLNRSGQMKSTHDEPLVPLRKDEGKKFKNQTSAKLSRCLPRSIQPLNVPFRLLPSC